MEEKFSYRAGVVMIGSLLWDDNNGRKEWRNKYFGDTYEKNIIDLSLPIRYGRFSTGKKRLCPTMVLSHTFLIDNKIGNGKFLPFKNTDQTIEELIIAAKDFSKAEKDTCNKLVKGSNKWCIMLCWINPEMAEEKKNNFLAEWKNHYPEEIKPSLLSHFKMENEKEAVFNERGVVRFSWPDALKNIDIAFLTQTQPCNKVNRRKFSTPDEIACYIFEKPRYFVKNTLTGVITAEDELILAELKDMDQKQLGLNALNDGCNKEEIERFLKNFLKNLDFSF